MPTFQTTSFQYTPLEDHSFRLISAVQPVDPRAPLNFTLREYPVFGSPRYAALSYCWGSSAKTATIRVNEHLIAVTQNLHSALSDLAEASRNGRGHVHPHVNHLWVDAICIDQSNSRERDHQVKQMRKIYHSASIVLAYLGTEGPDTAAAFRALNADRPQRPPGTVRFHKAAAERGGADGRLWSHADETGAVLLQCEYWTRTWIVQG